MRVLLLILSILLLAPVYAQELLTDSKPPSGIKLIIGSDPEDAEVYIDGQLYGRTPLSVKELSPGTYEVKIKKEPFNTFVQKVECPALGFTEVFGVLSKEYALLNMESSITGAEVFLGDSLLGTTPLQNVRIPLGKHTLLVKSKDYLDWIAEVNAVPTRYTSKAVMKYKYGYLTLAKGPDGSEIFIDDKIVDAFQLNNFKVEVGEHKIEINHPSFNGPIKEDLLVGSETKSNMTIESGYFSFKSFFKSIFVPGLGQFQDNSKVKGITIFSGTLLTGLVWLNSELSNRGKIKDYNKAQADYIKPAGITTIVSAHNTLLSAYDAVKKSNSMKNITMGTFIAVYAYNLLDALIFHSSGRNLIITQEKPLGNTVNVGLSLVL